uniref:Uncharacterized protein n=1 Tax=Polynucleobacter necessarius subsp. necessarius (strain STIR1) TaxID=452638 RepID=B1XTW1_POLNS
MVQYGTKPLQITNPSLSKGISFIAMKLPYDEILDAAGKARPHYQIFHNWLKQQSDTLMGLKRAEKAHDAVSSISQAALNMGYNPSFSPLW